MSEEYKPRIFYSENEHKELEEILGSPSVVKQDFLKEMLLELCLNLNPSVSRNDILESSELMSRLIREKSSRRNGVWIFYPWLNLAIRILDKEDFVYLRTCRNREKTTLAEQKKLEKKSIGIVGLSVGYSVLMAIALERIVEKIKIADFDTIELTNLNRIFQPLSNIGLNKAVTAARAVYEIDPYMEIEVFKEGILVDKNLKQFFGDSSENSLDVIIDECDNGAVKLNLRLEARLRGIPVLMDTSDRSVLDIERYDLDSQYPLLHGMLEEYAECREINEELGRKILFDSIDFTKVSSRGKHSMELIGKSIRTWPQLGTDVLCGGVSVAIAAKKILLGESIHSQRIYIDLGSQIN